MNEQLLMAHAKIVAASTRAAIRVAGMNALNTERYANGYALAYSEEAMLRVIEEEGIGHNDVISLLQGAA